MSNHLMELVLPPFTVTWFPSGEEIVGAVDADLLLVDHGDLIDDTIRVAQWALSITETELRGYTWCAHTAIVRGEIDGVQAVSEMGLRGHERRPLANYKHRLVALVHFDVSPDQRATAVAYDVACETLEYGYEQYPVFVLDDLTGAKLACSWGDALICSTQDTMVLMGLGLFPDRPPAMVVPARMALWFGAKYPASNVATKVVLVPQAPVDNH
jgi:hypothetical protein